MRGIGYCWGRWACGLVVASLLIVALLVPLASAQESTAIPSGGATPSASPAASPLAAGTPVMDTAGTVPIDPNDQALADKYAPVAMLKKQDAPCDPKGEPYLPVSVDVVLNDPNVVLRRAAIGGEDEDPIVKTGPSAQDLVNSDPTYYLDLPGDALDPGCTYETWSNERIKELGLQPITYARIATEPDRPGQLALQYYFYWVFNDFVDNHESDWEMVQLTFNASTSAEALTQDPVLVTYAQHAGGENGEWDASKLNLIDGTHLVTYPAAGSHADYYDEAVWIGWGEHGSGFGCDRSDPEFVPTPLKAVVVPSTIDPEGPFAWALFKGRWGEKHSWVFDGPKSPNITKRWTKPVSWTEKNRNRSLPIPQQSTLGMGPSTFFCSASNYTGSLMRAFPVYPQLIVGGFFAAAIALILVSFLTWRYLKRAFWMYLRYLPIFLLSSLLLIPVATLVTRIEDALAGVSRLLDEATDISVDATGAVGTSVGILLQVALISVIAPSVILATARLVRGERANFFSSVRETARLIPKIALATIWNSVLVTLLAITIVGIPFAIYRAVQWAYAAHAIVLDDATWRSSRHVSRNTIKGDWLRTLGMASLMNYVAILPGPIIGMLLIVIFKVPIEAAGTISSVIYAVMYPVSIITSTLYYLHRKQQKAERVAQGLPGDSPGQGFWIRVRHPRSWRDQLLPGPILPIPGPFPEAPTPDPGSGAASHPAAT